MQKNKLDAYVKSQTTTSSLCKIEAPRLTPDTQKLIPCKDKRDAEESEVLSVLSRAVAAIENEVDVDVFLGLAGALHMSIDGITTERIILANINTQLDTRETRLDKLTLNHSERISEVETDRTEEAAIRLQTRKMVSEEVIKVTAEILKIP